MFISYIFNKYHFLYFQIQPKKRKNNDNNIFLPKTIQHLDQTSTKDSANVFAEAWAQAASEGSANLF